MNSSHFGVKRRKKFKATVGYNVLENALLDLLTQRLKNYDTSLNFTKLSASKVKVTTRSRTQRAEAYRAQRCASSSNFSFVVFSIEMSGDSGKDQIGCSETVGGRMVSEDVAGIQQRCKRVKSW